jgi:hypothetical protein
MKKLSLHVCLLSCLLSLLCLTHGYAQTYAGVAFGLPTFNIHLGFRDAAAAGDLRVRFSSDFDSDTILAADLLFDVATITPDIRAYVGVAPELSVFSVSSSDYFGLGGAGLLGGRWQLGSQWHVFAEGGGAVRYGWVLEGEGNRGWFADGRASLGIGITF